MNFEQTSRQYLLDLKSTGTIIDGDLTGVKEDSERAIAKVIVSLNNQLKQTYIIISKVGETLTWDYVLLVDKMSHDLEPQNGWHYPLISKRIIFPSETIINNSQLDVLFRLNESPNIKEGDNVYVYVNDITDEYQYIIDNLQVEVEILNNSIFYNVVTPEYDIVTQKLGEIYYDENNDRYTREVINKTPQEKIEYLTSLGTQILLQTRNEIAEKELEVKYQANLDSISILDDSEALNVKTQYPPFNPNGYPYKGNERFYYPVDDKLYKVKPGQDHTSQIDWLPNTAVSLYEEVYVIPNNPCQETVAWDSNNWGSYTIGYQVKHNNSIWEAKNTTHTWIAPALTGDGAISWNWVQDC